MSSQKKNEDNSDRKKKRHDQIEESKHPQRPINRDRNTMHQSRELLLQKQMTFGLPHHMLPDDGEKGKMGLENLLF